MNAQLPHAFTLDHRDREGRPWCSVCRLPETNARARRLHDLHAVPRPRDWRERAAADLDHDNVAA